MFIFSPLYTCDTLPLKVSQCQCLGYIYQAWRGRMGTTYQDSQLPMQVRGWGESHDHENHTAVAELLDPRLRSDTATQGHRGYGGTPWCRAYVYKGAGRGVVFTLTLNPQHNCLLELT